MDSNDNGLKKVLTWAGIIALVAIPIVIFLRKKDGQRIEELTDDGDGNIFAADFEE